MKTILVVDDEEGIRASLSEILTHFGYRVITKSGCDSALPLFDGGAGVDLVITDYQMPGMDGLEFIARLKQVAPSLPVIFMTGYRSIEIYEKAIGLGVFGHMAKPVRIGDLVRTVAAALGEAEPGEQGGV